MRQKGFVPVIILVLVVLVVIGYFSYKNYWPKLQILSTPTPIPTVDPTANWKTYTSAKYKYSFKYPPNWIMDPDKQMPDEIVNISKDLNSLSIYAGLAFTKAPEGKARSKRREIKIARIDAVGEYYDGLYELISFTEKKTVNTISLRYAMGSYSEDFENRFDQILSTFKFTE